MVARVARRIEVGRWHVGGAAHDDRIDLVRKGYAEAVVLLPRDRPFDPADVAQLDQDARPAHDLGLAFGHHPAG